MQNNQHQFVISNDWAATGRWPGMSALHLVLRFHIIKWIIGVINLGGGGGKLHLFCSQQSLESRTYQLKATTSWLVRGLDSWRNKERSWSSWGKQTPWMFSHISRAAQSFVTGDLQKDKVSHEISSSTDWGVWQKSMGRIKCHPF